MFYFKNYIKFYKKDPNFVRKLIDFYEDNSKLIINCFYNSNIFR